MIFRTGGVNQRGAKLLRWMHPKLGAHPIIEFDAGLGIASSKHTMDARQFDKCIHHRGGVLRRHEDIQVAHCRTHPSQASSRLCVDDSLHLLELFAEFLRDWVGAA